MAEQLNWALLQDNMRVFGSSLVFLSLRFDPESLRSHVEDSVSKHGSLFVRHSLLNSSLNPPPHPSIRPQSAPASLKLKDGSRNAGAI